MNASSNLKTIAVAAIAIVSALMFVPMMADESDAVTDLGVFPGGTSNVSTEDATYSGIGGEYSGIVGHYDEVFYLSMGAVINIELNDAGYFKTDDANVFNLEFEDYALTGTVSCYGVTHIEAWSSAYGSSSFEFVCLPPGVTDLGIYTGSTNKSSENALYRGIEGDSGTILNYSYMETDVYVMLGAEVNITNRAGSYASGLMFRGGDGLEGLSIVDDPEDSGYYASKVTGFVSEYGQTTIEWNGEAYICCYINCLEFKTTYTVVFDSNGGSTIDNFVTDSDGIVTAPEDPVLSGYIFGGWYTDDNMPFDFSQPISEDITLHAKWIETLVFTTVPTSSGTVKAVPMMAGTIVCDASQSSDYTSILWDLGDGTTSTNTYVTHYYSQPGTYEVTLTVFNEHGTDVTTYTVEVPASSTGGGGHDDLLLYIAVGLLAALLIAVVVLRLL